MQAFFQSLSLMSASVLVAILSGLAALLFGYIDSVVARWCAAVSLPSVVAYCVYWMPVWLGDDGDLAQYSAWRLIGVGFPFLAGLIVSCVVTPLVAWHARRNA